MKECPIIIIGAGPAGLAVAGRLSKLGIKDYILLESSDKVGNAWHNHYERLHLHTIKEWSHLPLMPFPEEYPQYVSRQGVVDYLEKYAETFKIKPHFNHTVTSITKENASESSNWLVSTDRQQFITKYVVVATGVNHTPLVPDWSVNSPFTGDIIHSRSYKNAIPYKNKKVLVVGMGNTGAELALDLAQNEAEVYLSVRSPIAVVPRDLNGRPVQVTAKMLNKIPFGIGDWLGSQIRKVYFGNLEPYGLEVSKVHPTVQLRETGKTPIVDIGTIDAIKKGKIKICREVIEVDKDSVITKDGQELLIDSILLATGYAAKLKSIVPSISSFLDDKNLPRDAIGTGEVQNLFFIGFDNYKVGGILGTIQDDSLTIVNEITK